MQVKRQVTRELKTLGLAVAGLVGALAFAAPGLAATDPAGPSPANKAPVPKAPVPKASGPKAPVAKAEPGKPAAGTDPGARVPAAKAPVPPAKVSTAAGKPAAEKAPVGTPPADIMPPSPGLPPPPADTGPATTGAIQTGKVSGLPVPRYVSLKTDRVNLREGPSKDNRTAWVFQRAGLPVEITAEYETWRRIRDAEGTEGWVLHSLLSGRRTALVMPWAKAGTDALPLFGQADDKSQMVARLQPNVIASVKSCRDGWCRVTILQPDSREVGGYMRQDKLWGVYPNEKVE